MRSILLTILLLFPFMIFSQVKAIVVDKDSHQPVSFASVYVINQMKGTSTNFDGSFELKTEDGDSLIISSVGYESITVLSNNIKDSIFLPIQILKMEEVKIKPTQKLSWFPEKNMLGSVSNLFFNNSSWIGTSGYPYEIARYFNYEDKIAATRFISSVIFVTDSEIDDALFQVKFYKKASNGLPRELINTNKIIAKAKKGVHKTKVEVQKENIYFPKDGLFVAIEFLIIDQNKVKKDNPFLYDGKLYEYDYEPNFSTVQNEAHPFFYTKNIKKQLWNKIANSIGPHKNRNSLECKIILIE